VHDDVTITDLSKDVVNGGTGGGDASSACGSSGTGHSSERGIDVGRVGSWATDFEKLLRDPLGLQTFTVSELFFRFIIQVVPKVLTRSCEAISREPLELQK
jgi:hypothetical protein